MACLSITALIVLLAPTSNAEFYDGNELLRLMQVYEKATNEATTDILPMNTEGFDNMLVHAWAYRAYVMGVFDATWEQYNAPEGTTDQQVCMIVAKFLKENQDKWHLSGATIVKAALQAAFPKSE